MIKVLDKFNDYTLIHHEEVNLFTIDVINESVGYIVYATESKEEAISYLDKIKQEVN